jgi:hypothetical protein
MQIDRRPNRGPYVAALVCLLTLCLTIPLYWQSGAGQAKQYDANDYESITATLGGHFVRLDRYSGYGPKLPGDGSVDTLDELLFQLANRPGGITSDQPDLFMELLGPTAPGSAVVAEAPTGVIWQYARVLLRSAGREVVKFEPGQQIASLVASYYQHERVEAPRSEPLPTFSLLLTSPNDRLAMLPPREPRAAEAAVDAFPTPWCVPETLIDRLEILAAHPQSADWARQTIAEVRALTASDLPRTSAVAAHLERLQLLTDQAFTLAEASGDDCLRAELLRAHWGLMRRLECWSLMRDIAVASVAKNRFAAREPWDGSPGVLAGQGTAPADLYSLSGDLEAYEKSRSPRLARTILQRQRQLAEANDEREQDLANQIEQNYRNANVRFALSAELLQRFIPKQQSETSAVHDRIVGTPVRGQSITSSDNKVNLEPDSQRWHVNLESDGTVDSDTISDAGQVKLHTLGSTSFTAAKSILVERDGVQLGASTADAKNTSRLVGVRTDFDWMPIVNDVVRDRAIEEDHKKRSRAKAEVECKVADRVEEQLDDRAGQAVDKVQNEMREQVTGPLEAAGVELTPIELSTTALRVIARLRVAGAEQLGGHTPRPRAPADSLASVQVHESALTNAAVSLGLDGKRLTAPELQTLIREKLSRSTEPSPTLVEADTVFEFAPQDAVRFRVADQKLELILSMREVNHQRSIVQNFRVHAFYVPVLSGLEAEFVRDGALGVEGRIRTGERAAMFAVFSKVLTEDRKLPIVRLNDPNDERLAGLMITQLVLEDGWIGMAIGPRSPDRTAERTRMLR